jgi:hypothetical protein
MQRDVRHELCAHRLDAFRELCSEIVGLQRVCAQLKQTSVAAVSNKVVAHLYG